MLTLYYLYLLRIMNEVLTLSDYLQKTLFSSNYNKQIYRAFILLSNLSMKSL